MQRSKARRPSAIAIELQIDGETWHRVDALDESGPDDRHFVVITDDNGIANIRFGDGKHGARLPTRTDRIAAVYGSSKRFVAVVQQQGRVIVDKDWNEGSDSEGRLCGLYRGVVTHNVDPSAQGRAQVQLGAVLANQVVWAMPCRPVGSTDVPPIGAGVWVAFEDGDPTRPVWIGVSQ